MTPTPTATGTPTATPTASPTPTATPTPYAPWPMFHYDMRRAGLSYLEGPAFAGLRWSYRAGGVIQSSAAIGASHTCYIGSDDSRLYALLSEGTLGWSYFAGTDKTLS